MEGEGTDIGFSDVALPGESKRVSSRVVSGLWLGYVSLALRSRPIGFKNPKFRNKTVYVHINI